MPLDERQERELTGAGDTLLHYHLSDRTPTQDTLNGLNKVSAPVTITTDTTLTYDSNTVLVDTTVASRTITLPPARDGKEIEVIKATAPNKVIVLPTGNDTILGALGATISAQWTAIRFKAAAANWVAV